MEILIGWFLLVIAITIHEFAHAFAAEQLGDPTARIMGRLSLNPIVHMDPIGTVLLPLLLFFSGSSFFIGWAKPTPFDPFNLRNPKRDSALIALAGPVSNLLFATVLAIIYRLPIPILNSQLGLYLYYFIQMNIVLAIFNLIPVHPLDGFKVVAGILPHQYYQDWLSLERYGMLLLLFLIFPFFGASPLSTILSPIVNLVLSILLPARVGGII